MLSSTPPVRKAKISLADYPFHRDIEIRLLMSQLNTIEVEVLREIIHHSLIMSIEQLAEDIGITIELLLPILDKLSAIKLFKRQNKTLIIDKEMRKYLEIKIEKFDEDFRPDLDFLQSILNKVPIHILPLWYAIPRSSDNIFESIIEKYFLTPQIYRQYLAELQFDNPIIQAIIQGVCQPPHFEVTVAELMTKFDLPHRSIEEYLLLLEYHFVCCLSYRRVDDTWEEIVAPFSEWHEYLKFEAQTKPLSIPGPVEKHQQVEFQFIKDLIILLEACQSKKVLLKEVKNLYAEDSIQRQAIANKLIQVGFAKQNASGHITITEKGRLWLLKPFFEQVATLANDSFNTPATINPSSSLWNVRNLRLIEKSLKQFTPNAWVEFRHFLHGFIAPIGDKEPVSLKSKGKRWKYVIPTYTDQETQFVYAVIMERLAELGVVETGLYQGEPCFRLTSFGHHCVQ